MVDEVSRLEFDKGTAVIAAEIDARLMEHHISNASVQHDSKGALGPLVFSISVGGKSVKAEFSVKEVQDSAHAIDHPAANKVRQLVSHFVI